MTPHEAMAAWAGACAEFESLDAELDALTAALSRPVYASGQFPGSKDRAWLAAYDAYAIAALVVRHAHSAAYCAYEDSAPAGAAQMLDRLVGDRVYDTDVLAVEAAIAAVLAPPLTRLPCVAANRVGGAWT